MRYMIKCLILLCLVATTCCYAYHPDCNQPTTKNERLVCAAYNRVKKDIDKAENELIKEGFHVPMPHNDPLYSQSAQNLSKQHANSSRTNEKPSQYDQSNSDNADNSDNTDNSNNSTSETSAFTPPPSFYEIY